jgi:uncharacterized repeat protein (TIGR03803 family)
MLQTKVTRMLSLAGFVPAGKAASTNQQPRLSYEKMIVALGVSLAVALAASAAGVAYGQVKEEPPDPCLSDCKLRPAQSGPQDALAYTYQVLYTFTGGADGYGPTGLIHDDAGNLYGTTVGGGSNNCIGGCGAVYKLDAAGQTTLYTFTGVDGGVPLAGVIRDAAGNLYGTTVGGGSNNCTNGCGVVYKLDAAGQETVLHNFTNGADGGSPDAALVRDAAGNLFGTAQAAARRRLAWFFKLDAAGQETVLHRFSGGADGAGPQGLTLGASENLYGTTISGGAANSGVVYKLDIFRFETVLYTFSGGADGGYPIAGVIRDSGGNFYGTTAGGGTGTDFAGWGVVYKLDTSGQETVLHTFTGGADGGFPTGLIEDKAGNLYGTTEGGGIGMGWAGSGVVYKLDPAGHQTVLYTFTGGADGYSPSAGLIQDAAGNLYGTTAGGGSNNCYDGCGVVFKLTRTAGDGQ